MNRLASTGILALSACLFLCGPSTVSAGQQASTSSGQSQASQAAQPQQGPLVLQPVTSGWVVAPDVRVTTINGSTETLLGAYGGWVAENGILLGGGGYFDLNDHSSVGMSYGGFVVGWSMPAGGAIRFGARALIGGGEANLPGTFTYTVPIGFGPHNGMPGFGPDHDHDLTNPTTFTQHFHYHQGFFVAEPQADVIVRLNNWIRFNAGVGYRVIGAANGAESDLRGIVGSFAVRFGASGS